MTERLISTGDRTRSRFETRRRQPVKEGLRAADFHKHRSLDFSADCVYRQGWSHPPNESRERRETDPDKESTFRLAWKGKYYGIPHPLCVERWLLTPRSLYARCYFPFYGMTLIYDSSALLKCFFFRIFLVSLKSSLKTLLLHPTPIKKKILIIALSYPFSVS